MKSTSDQIEQRQLVCPRSHQPLIVHGDLLRTPDGRFSYPFLQGVPVLLSDPDLCASYLASQDGAMVAEYSRSREPSLLRKAYDRTLAAVGDMRSAASDRAFQAIFENLPADALCISIGGGPTRAHPALVNLNIGLFPNVEVVADAYSLPYADGCVDALHCEAVLEHLEFPDLAVKEMFRVLRPGGQVFAATPFLQSFHGYPDHYQNFTLTGHRRLFERAGFRALDAGVCVGPTFALSDLSVNYCRSFLPGNALRKLVSRGLALFFLSFRFIDRRLQRHALAADVASTTFVLCLKPSGAPDRRP